MIGQIVRCCVVIDTRVQLDGSRNVMQGGLFEGGKVSCEGVGGDVGEVMCRVGRYLWLAAEVVGFADRMRKKIKPIISNLEKTQKIILY